MQCLNCGLINPVSALRCDCGFVFSRLSQVEKANSEKIFKTNKHKFLLKLSSIFFFIGIIILVIYSFHEYSKVNNIANLTLLDHLKKIFTLNNSLFPNSLKIHALWPIGFVGIIYNSIMLKINNKN